MYYFAYGSNMSVRRLQARIRAVKVGIGKLSGYQLRFHKVSRLDGSGKCDAFYTGHPDEYLLGVVYAVSREDQKALNRLEGDGFGYAVKTVEIEMAGKRVEAVTYCAQEIDPALRPLDWYREHVARGAEEHDLDPAYVDRIRRIEVITDPDVSRREQELSIYE